jgi:hypothetical protein
MPQPQTILAENYQTRERLQNLAARLAPADLQRPATEAWAVADVLAHLAFWDWRALALLERWERSPYTLPDENPIEVDAVNEAAYRIARALPAAQAAQLALSAAEAVDSKLEALGEPGIAAILAAGSPVNPARSTHRAEHLDELERLLGQP